jgi:hypothetical protein
MIMLLAVEAVTAEAVGMLATVGQITVEWRASVALAT